MSIFHLGQCKISNKAKRMKILSAMLSASLAGLGVGAFNFAMSGVASAATAGEITEPIIAPQTLTDVAGINISSDAVGNIVAISATDGNKNSIIGVSSGININLTADKTADNGLVYGVYAKSQGVNELTNASTIFVQSTGNADGDNAAVCAANGENVITMVANTGTQYSGESVIKAVGKDSSGAVMGVSSCNADTNGEASDGTVVVSSSNAITMVNGQIWTENGKYVVAVNASGKNNVNTINNVHEIVAYTYNNAYIALGVCSSDGGVNYINTNSDCPNTVFIAVGNQPFKDETVAGNDKTYAYGIYAKYENSKNIVIHLADDSIAQVTAIDVEAQGQAVGILATTGGSNEVTGEAATDNSKTVEIYAESYDDDLAYGIAAWRSGSNTVSGVTHIVSKAKSNVAYGIDSYNSGQNTVTGLKNITVSNTTGLGAVAIMSEYNSTASVTANSASVAIAGEVAGTNSLNASSVEGGAYGILAAQNSTATVENFTDINVCSQGNSYKDAEHEDTLVPGQACAIEATHGSTVNVTMLPRSTDGASDITATSNLSGVGILAHKNSIINFTSANTTLTVKQIDSADNEIESFSFLGVELQDNSIVNLLGDKITINSPVYAIYSDDTDGYSNGSILNIGNGSTSTQVVANSSSYLSGDMNVAANSSYTQTQGNFAIWGNLTNNGNVTLQNLGGQDLYEERKAFNNCVTGVLTNNGTFSLVNTYFAAGSFIGNELSVDSTSKFQVLGIVIASKIDAVNLTTQDLRAYDSLKVTGNLVLSDIGGIGCDTNSADSQPTVTVGTLSGGGKLLVSANAFANNNSDNAFDIGTIDNSKVELRLSTDLFSTIDLDNLSTAVSDSLANMDKAEQYLLNGGAAKINFSGNGSLSIPESFLYGATTFDNNGVHEARNVNDSLTAIFSPAASMAKFELNDIRKRMGDLRNANAPKGLWLRNENGALSGSGTEDKFHKWQLGMDEALSEKWHLGAAFAMTSGSSNFANGYDSVKGYSGAVYGMYTGNDGKFADIIARYGVSMNRLDFAPGGVIWQHGDTRQNSYSLSGEIGRTIQLPRNYYIEPQLELTYTKTSGADFTTPYAHYNIDGSNSFIGRIGTSFGYYLKDKGTIYTRLSCLHEFSGDSGVNVGLNCGLGRGFTYSGRDTWLEWAIGGQYQTSKATYVYADLERTFGADINEKYRLNLGLRFSF